MRGRVLDADGNPVAGARVALKSRGPDLGTTAYTTTDADGEMVIRAVRAGAQTMRATADGYLESDPVSFDLRESDRERRIDVRLPVSDLRRITAT